MNKETWVNLPDLLAEICKREVKSQVTEETFVIKTDLIRAINQCRKLEVGR